MARYRINEQQLFGSKTQSILDAKDIQPGLRYNGISFRTVQGIVYMQYGSQSSAQAQFNLISSSIDLNNMLMCIDYVFNTRNQILGYKAQDNCVLYPGNGDDYLKRILRFYHVDLTKKESNYSSTIYWRLEGRTKQIDEHYKNHLNLDTKIEWGTLGDKSWDLFEHVNRAAPREKLDRYDNQYVPEIKIYDQFGDNPAPSLKYASILYLDHCYKDIRDTGTKGKNQYNAKVVYNDDNAYLHLNEVITLNSNRQYLENLSRKAVLARTYYGDGKVEGTILSNREFLNFGGFANYYYDSNLLTEYGYLKPGLTWFKAPGYSSTNTRYTFINQDPKPFVLYVDHILRLLGYVMTPNKVIINGFVVDTQEHKTVYCTARKYFTVAVNTKNSEIHITGEVEYDNLFEYQSDKTFLHISQNGKIEVCLYNQPATEEYLRLLANVVKDRYEIHLLEYNVTQGNSVNTLIENIQNKMNQLGVKHQLDKQNFAYRLTPKTNILDEAYLDKPKIVRGGVIDGSSNSESEQYHIASAQRPQTPLIYDYVFVVQDSSGTTWMLHYAYYSKIAYFKFVGKTALPQYANITNTPCLLSLSGNDVSRKDGELEHDLNKRIFQSLKLTFTKVETCFIDTNDWGYDTRYNVVDNVNLPKIYATTGDDSSVGENSIPLSTYFRASHLFDVTRDSDNYHSISILNYLPGNHYYNNICVDQLFQTDSILNLGLSRYQKILALFQNARTEEVSGGYGAISAEYKLLAGIGDYRNTGSFMQLKNFNKFTEYPVADYVKKETNKARQLVELNEQIYYTRQQNQTVSITVQVGSGVFDLAVKYKTAPQSIFKISTDYNPGDYLRTINILKKKYAVVSKPFTYKEYIFSPEFDVLRDFFWGEPETWHYKKMYDLESYTKHTKQAVYFYYTLGGTTRRWIQDICVTPSNFLECSFGQDAFPMLIKPKERDSMLDVDEKITRFIIGQEGLNSFIDVINTYPNAFKKFVAYATYPGAAYMKNRYYQLADAPYKFSVERSYDNNRWASFRHKNTGGAYYSLQDGPNSLQNAYSIPNNLIKQIMGSNRYYQEADFDGGGGGDNGGGPANTTDDDLYLDVMAINDQGQQEVIPMTRDQYMRYMLDMSKKMLDDRMFVKNLLKDGYINESQAQSQEEYFEKLRREREEGAKKYKMTPEEFQTAQLEANWQKMLVEQGKAPPGQAQLGQATTTTDLNIRQGYVSNTTGATREIGERSVGGAIVTGYATGYIATGALLLFEVSNPVGWALAGLSVVGAALGALFGFRDKPKAAINAHNRLPFLSIEQGEASFRLFHQMSDTHGGLGPLWPDAAGTPWRFPQNPRVLRYTLFEGFSEQDVDIVRGMTPGGDYKNNIIANRAIVSGKNIIFYNIYDYHTKRTSENSKMMLEYNVGIGTIDYDQNRNLNPDDEATRPHIKTQVDKRQYEATFTYAAYMDKILTGTVVCLAYKNTQIEVCTNTTYEIANKLPCYRLSLFGNDGNYSEPSKPQIGCYKNVLLSVNKMLHSNRVYTSDIVNRPSAFDAFMFHATNIGSVVSGINNSRYLMPHKFNFGKNQVKISSVMVRNNGFVHLNLPDKSRSGIFATYHFEHSDNQYMKYHNSYMTFNNKIITAIPGYQVGYTDKYSDNNKNSEYWEHTCAVYTNVPEYEEDQQESVGFKLANELYLVVKPFGIIYGSSASKIAQGQAVVTTTVNKVGTYRSTTGQSVECYKYAYYFIQNPAYSNDYSDVHIDIQDCVFHDANKY